MKKIIIGSENDEINGIRPLERIIKYTFKNIDIVYSNEEPDLIYRSNNYNSHLENKKINHMYIGLEKIIHQENQYIILILLKIL